jgi:hypothetical protein
MIFHQNRVQTQRLNPILSTVSLTKHRFLLFFRNKISLEKVRP